MKTSQYLMVAAAALLAPLSGVAQTLAGVPMASSLTEVTYSGLAVLVELTKSLAWPLVALVIAVWFRKPIGNFIEAIGGRISRLSVFSFEFELLAATPSTAAPSLDDIRTATSSAQVSDSSRAMLEQAQSTEPAEFSLIALGHGDEWLTSRLFIAAVMMERMRGVKVFVFVERTADSERHFVAVADVRQLRWALAKRFPWLQAAFVKAEALQAEDPQSTTTVKTISDTGAMEPWKARDLVSSFIDALQRPSMPSGAPESASGDWVRIGHAEERASWVTRRLMAELLPERAFAASAKALLDESRARRSRALLRCPVPYVALVNDGREFLRLVNRQAYLEELAVSLGEEPDSGAVATK